MPQAFFLYLKTKMAETKRWPQELFSPLFQKYPTHNAACAFCCFPCISKIIQNTLSQPFFCLLCYLSPTKRWMDGCPSRPGRPQPLWPPQPPPQPPPAAPCRPDRPGRPRPPPAAHGRPGRPSRYKIFSTDPHIGPIGLIFESFFFDRPPEAP